MKRLCPTDSIDDETDRKRIRKLYFKDICMKRSTLQTTGFVISILIAQCTLAETTTLSKHDQLKIAVQKICPVSGKPLGSMGAPTKVKVGDEEIFICCQGCTQGQINRQHWATIHANFANAQGKCPVMEKALPVKPKWTIVKGQIIYICCPPCTKKIQADPGKYLAKIDAYYNASLKQSSNDPVASHTGHADERRLPASTNAIPKSRDQLRIAVQGICPVSGNRLGSMGETVKVKAGGVDLFLCCEGCRQGKVDSEHWTTIHSNIANAQGICPVMEKKLPANPASTIVNGQVVFVCCPPCTKKIEAEPAKFLAKVDSYYESSLRQQANSSTVSR